MRKRFSQSSAETGGAGQQGEFGADTGPSSKSRNKQRSTEYFIMPSRLRQDPSKQEGRGGSLSSPAAFGATPILAETSIGRLYCDPCRHTEPAQGLFVETPRRAGVVGFPLSRSPDPLRGLVRPTPER